jgi:D-alanyl-lipoteichoic acid acyltransferase DltB (MBOAT superfamily)
MTFASPGFPLFFIVTIAIYYWLSNNTHRKAFLVVASFFFYAAWDYRFLALLAFVIFAAWGGTWALGALSDPRQRKVVLTIAIAVQLVVLAFFKYFIFFTNNLTGLLVWLGIPELSNTIEVVLPVGLSFYIFHSISLLVDFNSGKLGRSLPSLLDVALYIAFFPQLVSGPIVRSTVFLPQLATARRFDPAKAERAISLIMVGYVYKMLLSDNIAAVIDPVFKEPTQWDVAALWTASIGYYSQIYFDFAGYTNIAIGISLLLGYELPKNFDFPYGAASITDFWRRWHISLSFWLRDYLFIPLGGSRGSFGFYFRNIMITMVLGGLWHGASWNFVIWGALHGLGLAMHKAWLRVRPNQLLDGALTRPASWVVGLLLTQLWVLILWIFFRIQDFDVAMQMIGRMFGMTLAGSLSLAAGSWPAILAMALPIGVDTLIGCLLVRRERHFYVGAFRFGLLAGAIASVVIAALALQTKPFIYFNF